jgi:glycosyltransferase involved in cell wall biosynthesis
VSDPTSGVGRSRVLIALTSLCAEGTPVLTLDICRRWMASGIEPTVMTLADRPDDLAAEFRDQGVPVERVRLPPRGAGRFTALALTTYELCRRLRPRAFLSMPLGWHAFMFMGARAAGVLRTAAHVGNYPPVHDDRKALAKFRFLVQLGRPLTDQLICCSSYIQAGVVQHFGVPADETAVVYNGVDVKVVADRAAMTAAGRRARGPGPYVVGMVARLEVHKDQPTLIRAAALLRGAGRPIEVWLIGEGSRRQEYERLVAELNLASTVRLLGMRRDVPELLGQMDAFVFSAKPDEGLGVALIEAMAAGVPIIATNVGACREVLLDGALGELVPGADAAAMALAIRHLADGATTGIGRLDRARARALATFSIDQMADAYARILGIA